MPYFCIYGIWSHSFNGNQFWGFKVELSEFFSDFLVKFDSSGPHTPSKFKFFTFARQPNITAFINTKMSKKSGSYKLLARKQEDFFPQKLTIFQQPRPVLREDQTILLQFSQKAEFLSRRCYFRFFFSPEKLPNVQ